MLLQGRLEAVRISEYSVVDDDKLLLIRHVQPKHETATLLNNWVDYGF